MKLIKNYRCNGEGGRRPPSGSRLGSAPLPSTAELPVSRDGFFLKCVVILKKRKGGGFDHYMNERDNYNVPSEYLNWRTGFKSWADVQRGRPWQLPGFVAVQMRPRARLIDIEGNPALSYFLADYADPPEQWKFRVKHQPFELPGWVHVGEIRRECIRLLRLWGRQHLIANTAATIGKGQAVAALAGARIDQRGGIVWAYKDAEVIQHSRESWPVAHLHDRAVAVIRWACMANGESSVELHPGGRCEAHDQATVTLVRGPGGEVGQVTCHDQAKVLHA